MKDRRKGFDLREQSLNQLLARARRQAWNVVDGFVSIQLHALPACSAQGIDHMGMDPKEPQLKGLKQSSRSRAHDQRIGLNDRQGLRTGGSEGVQNM